MRREEIIIEGKKERVYYFKNKSGFEFRALKLGTSDLSSCIDDNIEIGDELSVGGGFIGEEYLIVDECVEAWKILAEVLLKNNPQTFEEKCECVQEAINSYFGDFSNAYEREAFYHGDGVKLSSFAHKNIAACTERATLSHMMLKFIGINSTLRISDFTNNEGNLDHHAYNLIENDDSYYLYDSTQPTLNGKVISPILAKIPKEIYEGLRKRGMGIHVTHYNPMTGKDYDVIYNPGGEVYDVNSQKEK